MLRDDSRRRWLRSVALGGAASATSMAGAAEPALDPLRQVAAAHGMSFTDERLRGLKPILEQRQAQLRALRELAIDDSVGPTRGV